MRPVPSIVIECCFIARVSSVVGVGGSASGPASARLYRHLRDGRGPALLEDGLVARPAGLAVGGLWAGRGGGGMPERHHGPDHPVVGDAEDRAGLVPDVRAKPR